MVNHPELLNRIKREFLSFPNQLLREIKPRSNSQLIVEGVIITLLVTLVLLFKANKILTNQGLIASRLQYIKRINKKMMMCIHGDFWKILN